MADPENRYSLAFLEGASEEASRSETEWLQEYGDYNWDVNHSTMRDYSSRALIEGRESGLLRLIQEHVGKDQSSVGLDLAAGNSAQALKDLVISGVLGKALATNFQDLRPTSIKNDPRISHVAGNLLLEDTWNKILHWKKLHAPDGFSLIMHRPIGALQDQKLKFYQGATHLLLNMLDEGGLLFTQIPRQIVFNSRQLPSLCRDVRTRRDIASIHTTEGRRIDEADHFDMYAVIVKK